MSDLAKMAAIAKHFVTNGDGSVHLHSENGTAYELAVGNDGALTVTNEATGEEIPSGSGLPTGGAAHQQLVIDAEGKALWEDRTHYAFTTESVVYEETTLEVPADDSVLVFTTPPVISPVAGGKYTVIWNGVPYACEGGAFEENGVQFVILGNGSVTGGDDTGEPFGMLFYPADVVTAQGGGMYAIVVVFDGSTTVTIKVTTEVEEVKKIDDKFLDLTVKRVYSDAVVGSDSTYATFYRDPGLTDKMPYAEVYEILVKYGGKICAQTDTITLDEYHVFTPMLVTPMSGFKQFYIGLTNGNDMQRFTIYCSDTIFD